MSAVLYAFYVYTWLSKLTGGGAQPAAKPKVAVKPTVHGAKKGQDRVYWNISHPGPEVWESACNTLKLTLRFDVVVERGN